MKKKFGTIAAIGHSPVCTPAVEPTCTQIGLTEGSHCSVCNVIFKEQEMIPATGHSIDSDGVCPKCGYIDKTSDAYKLRQLKKRAESSVFSCAETALRTFLKNPDSMVVLHEKITDQDDYLRYAVTIQYKATNNLGGYITDYAYFLIRVCPTLDGKFYHKENSLGIKYFVTDSDKTAFGWGEQPSDWSLDAIVDISTAEEVSLKQILAYPSKYNGKFVKIKEQLALTSNDLSKKKILCLHVNGKW